MSIEIRKMQKSDKTEVLKLMKEFYSSDAVYTNGSDEIFEADFEACISDMPFLEGYTFLYENQIVGYAMLAKSFSTEFGKKCVWIEDVYVDSNFRSFGIGSQFLNDIREKYSDSIFRLEVEEENEKAIKLYKRFGFELLPYIELKK